MVGLAGYTDETSRGEGIGAYLEYKRLLIAQAIADGDSVAVIDHSLAIMAVTGLSGATGETLASLVRCCDQNTELWKAAITLDRLAAPGKLWKFILNNVHE